MTFSQLTDIFESWGYAVKPEHYFGFKRYCQAMMKMGRVIIIINGPSVEALVFFFITDDYRRLYKKGEWHIALDNPQGEQMYVDKMICKRWTPEIRRKLQSLIEHNFPNVKEAFYHRAPFDRCVRIKRREVPCTR